MELIDYTIAWVKGEVFQGKIMLAIGILLLFGGIAILKKQWMMTNPIADWKLFGQYFSLYFNNYLFSLVSD